MIRVLQFADIVNRYDFIDTIIRHADRSRFDVGLCVRSAENNVQKPTYSDCTSQFLLIGTSRRAYSSTAVRLARLLRREKIDLLHTHHYDQAVVGWLATRIYPRARLIIGRHYSDAIHRQPRTVKRAGLLQLEQVVNRAADRIIVPSAQILQLLAEQQQVDPAKIDVVPYGFEPEKYSAPSSSQIQAVREEFGMNGRFVIGSFGRLHEEKGHRYLLDAASVLKDKVRGLLVLIVGDGPERARLENRTRALRLQATVRFAGWRRDAIRIMSAVDAVVQPTLHEAFSQVMVEALWMRKPLVITDVSGATDIIRDGENGILVPNEDAAALASAIERLAGAAGLRERLGSAGGDYVERHLSIARIIPRYEESYLRAMQS